MNRKFYLLAATLALTALLTACGGNSGGSASGGSATNANTQAVVAAALPDHLQHLADLSVDELQALAEESAERALEIQAEREEREEEQRQFAEEQRLLAEEREAERIAAEERFALIEGPGELFQRQWASEPWHRYGIRFIVHYTDVIFLSLYPGGELRGMDYGTYGTATFDTVDGLPTMIITTGDTEYLLEINPRWSSTAPVIRGEPEGFHPVILGTDSPIFREYFGRDNR